MERTFYNVDLSPEKIAKNVIRLNRIYLNNLHSVCNYNDNGIEAGISMLIDARAKELDMSPVTFLETLLTVAKKEVN